MLKEYHSFLFHNLTNVNHKRSRTNAYALLLLSDQFYQSIRNRDSVYGTCFCWFKQAVCLVSFSREFNVLIQFFVSGVTWSVHASSVALGWKHVIYLEAAA